MKHVVVVLMLLWAASEASAGYESKALYVATNGSDSNDGSTPSWRGTGTVGPLATPGRALELARQLESAGTPIDFVYLRAAGTAAERRYALTRPLVVRKRGLTIATYPDDSVRAVLIAGTSSNSPNSVVIVYASGVTIENLEIQGGAYYGIKLDDADGAQTGQRIIGNYIHHTGRDGIKTQRADGVRIENNEIGPTGVRDASNAEGIDMIASLGAVIRANYIHDVTTNGLYVKGGTRNAVVEGNLVVNAGAAGILLGSETAVQYIRNYLDNYGDSDGTNSEGHEALDSSARNNIVVNTRGAGLGTIAGSNVEFLNNTLVNVAASRHGGFRAAPNQYGTLPKEPVAFKNNIVILAPASVRPLLYAFRFCKVTSDSNVWFSEQGPYNFAFDSTPCGTTTYSDLNAWQLATGNDARSKDLHAGLLTPRLDPHDLYRPFADSPAVDAGAPLTQVGADYDGIPRPQGGRYDIGAHERPTMPSLSLPAAPHAYRVAAYNGGFSRYSTSTWSERRRGSAPAHTFMCGSSQSRRALPIRLMARVVTKIARPGKVAIHHEFSM